MFSVGYLIIVFSPIKFEGYISPMGKNNLFYVKTKVDAIIWFLYMQQQN
jgi:hypothetical protein